MELNDLYKLRDCNELDLIFKIIEIAENNKKRTEQFLKVNDTAGKDIRQSMQDIRLIAEIIRESVQIKKGKKSPKQKEYKGKLIPFIKLEKAIVDKIISLENEEVFIKRAENLRKEKRNEY